MRERSANDDGYTMVELMVVVLILGILLTVALPTLLGARERAEDRAAQSDLRYALTAARAIQTDTEDYSKANALPTGLVTMESSLCYVDATTVSVYTGATCVTGHGQASVSVKGTTTAFGAARMSATMTCFVIYDTGGLTHYGTTGIANCTGEWAATPGNVTATSLATGGW
ncbi:MAG: prepilin-type N-terminal cleavage/methylation domain-containing protein [Actinobacteria bacterium]|nr:prepilin-type N-terminal cleavage/methylation domain-containing protein [Actinomycetota bacterium]